MKRIFTIFSPWVAAFFATSFMVITPMAYYRHLSSCDHIHGYCVYTGCHHEADAGVLCARDRQGNEPFELTASQNRGAQAHDPATCPICQGMAKLRQVIQCQSAVLFSRLNLVEDPPLPGVMAPSLSVRTSIYARAPPSC